MADAARRVIDRAALVGYDPDESGLSATTVQAALDELAPARGEPYRWVAAGSGITTGAKAGRHRVNRAGTAYQMEMTMEVGTATVAIEASTDNGATWQTTVGTISGSYDADNTATISAALAAGTKLRVNYTAVSGVEDVVITLRVR
jgi:uridine phosphorylase